MLTAEQITEAISQQRLVLFYQPQISLQSGVVSGCEALVRLLTPSDALIFPDDFIPVAEEAGLITQLTQYLFARFIDDMTVIHDVFPHIHVSMNISQQDVLEDEFIKQVEQYRRHSGSQHAGFSFEITETSALNTLDRDSGGFSRLLKTGVNLIMDDFGTGYANLYSLSHSPFAKLKIDKSFIGAMLRDEKRMIIVKDSLSLAHRLGMDVVAEGVEDEKTANALVRLGCSHAQGYLFAKALSLDAFMGFVHDWTPNFTPSPIGLLYHAESDHLEWRKDLISTAFSFDPATDDIALLYERFALSPTACHFGRWYHADNVFKSLDSFKAIHQPHSELHYLGHTLINEAIKPDRSNERMVEIAREIADYSIRLLQSLHALEQEVLMFN